MLTSERIADAYREACRAELAALKPGNVHVFADGHGMTVADFEVSADASAGPLALAGAGVGRRVLEAVRATRRAVGQNTNLGIVLLCAPLARAAAEGSEPLPERLETVLARLDREDARLAFEAIRLAAPAGLGAAPRHDVREKPECTLREAMREAAARDRIAAAYADGYREIFGAGLRAAEAKGRPGLPWWRQSAVYLAFLRSGADSHVLRKHGPEAAEAVRREADELWRELGSLADGEVQERLLGFDLSLKRRGLNPGTCADLTVATLFAASLQHILREASESGSLARGGVRAPLLSGQPVRRHAGR